MSVGTAKKFDFSTAKGVVMITVVIAIVILVIIFGKQIATFINGLGNSINSLFGFKPNPAVDAASKAEVDANTGTAVDPNGPWGTALYNSSPDASTLDYSTLQSMASNIDGAVNPYLPNSLDHPDGSTMLAQFKMCNNQIDVSNLVVVFSALTSQDLYDFVSHNLSNNSDANTLILQQILLLVQRLPLQ